MWYKEPMQVIFKLSELSMIFEGGKKYSKGGKKGGGKLIKLNYISPKSNLGYILLLMIGGKNEMWDVNFCF